MMLPLHRHSTPATMLAKLIFLALFVVSAWGELDDVASTFQEVQDYVKSLDAFEYEWKRECHIGSGEPCNLTAFEKDETTMVFPGGETRCIFSNTPEFAFQVRED